MAAVPSAEKNRRGAVDVEDAAEDALRAAGLPRTLLNSHAIVGGEYFGQRSLCADDRVQLNRLKRRLISMRSGQAAMQRGNEPRSPVRRPSGGAPRSLHRVFADVMNRDSCASVVADGERIADDVQYPKWQVNYIKLEDIIGPYTLDSLTAGTSSSCSDAARDETAAQRSDNAEEQRVRDDPKDCRRKNDRRGKPQQPLKRVKKPIGDAKSAAVAAKTDPGKNASSRKPICTARAAGR